MTQLANGTLKDANFFRLAIYYRPHFGAILWGLFFLVGASLMEPLIPAMMKLLLDHTASNNHGISVRSWPVWGPPVAVILLFTGRSVVIFLANLALGSATSKAVLDMQKDTFNNLLRCDLSVFQNESASSLTNAVRVECAVAGQSFVTVVQDGGRNLLTVIALTGYLFWMNWKLTLITLAVMPLTMVLIRKVGVRIRRLQQSLMRATEALGYIIEENTAAHRIIRLHGAGADQMTRFSSEIQRMRGHLIRVLVANTVMTPLTQIAASISLAMILSIALAENQSGELSVGGLAAYITGMLMLISPLKGLGDTVPAFQRGRVAADRICEVMDYPLEPQGGTHRPTSARGHLRFENVGMQYPNHDCLAVSDVSLDIQQHQMVALVGASGSGKTTLANMIPCFVRPTKGRILLDGVDLREWDLSILRRQIAMVSQDTILFNDTILANVCLGSDVCDPFRAEAALRQAHLWEFVSSLPNGLETSVGHNGQMLSGGQRQRLSIARALYKKASVLILDEATSALDSESEQAIQTAIANLACQYTMIVIAHRLSTVRNADLIVVMDQGKVVEQGGYDELVQKQGIFSRLIAQQLSS